jgi:glucosamine kinase
MWCCNGIDFAPEPMNLSSPPPRGAAWPALPALHYLAGVDGGGSGTRLRLHAAPDGRALGYATAGPSGLSQGIEQAWRHIEQALAAAFVAAGLAPAPRREIALGLGLAGVEVPRQREAFLAADPGFACCVLFNDAQTTLRGAFGGGPGIVVAAGTGSIGLAQGHDGVQQRTGGWGFPVGDEGSGAWLGLRAMHAAQAALDGRGAVGPLAQAVWREVGAGPAALLQWCRSAGQHQYASLAPCVFEAALQGDAQAQALLGAAATELERHVHALSARMTDAAELPIALVGSIGKRLQARWPEPLRRRCVQPQGDSADGALALLRDTLRGTLRGTLRVAESR